MTPNPLFHSDNKDGAMAFMAMAPFAVLAVNGEAGKAQGPVSVMVPLVVDGTGQRLIGHVARSNPFWKAAQDSSAKAIAIFKGNDAYVTPALYPSKQEHGRVVPTWNYMALEVRGHIKVETDAAMMRPYLTALTDQMESHRDMPWKVSDAPDDYIEKLSHAIVGFTLEIDEISFMKKLSQNKREDDKNGIITAFENSNDPAQNNLAKEMNQEMSKDN